MPWCPVCKNEYQEGVTVCADCGADLVESLKERKEVPLADGDGELMMRMKKFMEHNDIPVISEEENGKISLYVLPKYQEKARSAALVFLSGEEAEAARKKEERRAAEDADNTGDAQEADIPIEEEIQNEIDEEESRLRRSSQTGVYETKRDKAGEMKSSGIMLLMVGLIGAAVVILADCNILPISIGNKVIVSIVMLIFFVFFAAFGIYCIKDAAVMRGEASSEEKLTEEIREWVRNALDAQQIDEKVTGLDADQAQDSDTDTSSAEVLSSAEVSSAEDASAEILYFKRTAYMRNMLADQFPDADELLIESLIEEFYQELFE